MEANVFNSEMHRPPGTVDGRAVDSVDQSRPFSDRVRYVNVAVKWGHASTARETAVGTGTGAEVPDGPM